MKASFRIRPCELRKAVNVAFSRGVFSELLVITMFCVVMPCRYVALSRPVMDIRARFVSRVYPVAGGGGGAAFCSCNCALDENGRGRARQRDHSCGRDLPGRIMVSE